MLLHTATVDISTPNTVQGIIDGDEPVEKSDVRVTFSWSYTAHRRLVRVVAARDQLPGLCHASSCITTKSQPGVPLWQTSRLAILVQHRPLVKSFRPAKLFAPCLHGKGSDT